MFSIFKIFSKNKYTEQLVSIIIPIFNYEKKIDETLQSVFNSTYSNYEIIIVNDGSTNTGVFEVLEKYKNHPKIKIFHNPKNLGQSASRNIGIRNSYGKYILPLDADDSIKPEYIQFCVREIEKNKKISPVYCDTIHIGEINYVEKRPNWSKKKLIKGPFIVNCSMFRREAFDICSGYDENLNGWEDYDLWIRMMLNGYIGKRISQPLFTYFHHEKDGTVSTDANKNINALHQMILKKNNLI